MFLGFFEKPSRSNARRQSFSSLQYICFIISILLNHRNQTSEYQVIKSWSHVSLCHMSSCHVLLKHVLSNYVSSDIPLFVIIALDKVIEQKNVGIQYCGKYIKTIQTCKSCRKEILSIIK